MIHKLCRRGPQLHFKSGLRHVTEQAGCSSGVVLDTTEEYNPHF